MRELTVEEQNEVGGGWIAVLLEVAALIGGVAALIEIWDHFYGDDKNGTVEVGPLKTLEDLGGQCIEKGGNLEISYDGKTYEYSCTFDSEGNATIESDGESVDVDADGNIIEDEEIDTDDGDDSGDDDSDDGASGDDADGDAGDSDDGDDDADDEGSDGDDDRQDA
ncbi:hypothetical protein SAMN05216359_108191 [Roseateles sp. YR242]|uniref:hypothetical protein n=1 Tax=Roseateles sp. YR242 TaxID=1855305 RepID=UPI0008B3FDB7|nr:hypothetical protein [Roseateles sp. YR242]SEL40424.1 hypothetical protein SAMN05216359_108191 [Roseateles sp. YR242]